METADLKKTSIKKTASSKQPTYKPKPVKKRTAKFAWPVKGTIISKYGTIGKGRNNDGINIRAAKGTAVKAADRGTVVYSGNELKGFGNLILIRHNDGWITAYAHNQKLLVKKGKRLSKAKRLPQSAIPAALTNPSCTSKSAPAKSG